VAANARALPSNSALVCTTSSFLILESTAPIATEARMTLSTQTRVDDSDSCSSQGYTRAWPKRFWQEGEPEGAAEGEGGYTGPRGRGGNRTHCVITSDCARLARAERSGWLLLRSAYVVYTSRERYSRC